MRKALQRLSELLRSDLRGKGKTTSMRDACTAAVEFMQTYLGNVVAAASLAGFTQMELFGTGSLEFMDLQTGNDCVSSAASFLVLAIIFLRMSLSRTGRIAMTGIGLGLAFLIPFWTMTDCPLVNAQNIDTMVGTNLDEAAGMLRSIPASSWQKALIGAVLITVLVSLAEDPHKNDAALRARMPFWKKTACMLLLTLPALTPLHDIGTGLWRIAKFNLFEQQPTWHVKNELPSDYKSDIHVIIMGEGLSDKVMGIYGAPFPTTPFLSSAPTLRLRKAVAPAMATATSVSLLTSFEDPDNPLYANFADNIVSLAREAELKTYWISSQGRVSAFEAGVSVVASKSDETHFISKHDDFGLLPTIREVIGRDEARRKFVFIHTFGSHEETCDRVKDIGRPWRTGEEFVDCYLASALKADRMVAEVVAALKATGKSWSLIFTSDHAISFRYGRSGNLVTGREPKWSGQFEVPMILMGRGADKPDGVVPVTRSTINLVKFFPTWIGVETNRTPVGYNLFSPESQADDTQIIVRQPDGTPQSYSTLKISPSLKEVIAAAKERKDK